MYYKRSTGVIYVRKSTGSPSWVQWVHHSEGKTHCPECLKLDGCFFTEAEHPPCPHHPYCHCTLEAIDYAIVLANVTVDSKYSKFDAYLFNTEGKYNYNKAKLFWDWGYDVADIPWMKAEWERQAYEKYLAGDYKLHDLDKWGQRINIRIEIPRKDTGEIVSFMSEWMVCPNGELQLATPYSRQYLCKRWIVLK